MADKKISQLEKLQNIDGTELIPVAKNGSNYTITPKQIVEDVEQNQAEDLAKITELQGKLNGIDNVQGALDKKADKSDVYTKTEADAKFPTKIYVDDTFVDTAQFKSTTDLIMQYAISVDSQKADKTTVDDILKLIPTQAAESNQLADKDFVNSSIATNTADFKGTFTSLENLKQQVADADANDYGFVVEKDGDGNTVYNRYKFVEGEGWKFEYALNNSSFTATQWAAINSNITSDLVAKLSALPSASTIASTYATKTELDVVETLAESVNTGLGGVIEDMKSLATKAEVAEATNDMATQTWVNDRGFLTEHQDISGLATKTELESTNTRVTTLEEGLDADKTNLKNFKQYVEENLVKDYDYNKDKETIVGQILNKADKATTLAGYGITDAKISGGTITLGGNTITPLTEHQSLADYLKSTDAASTYVKKTGDTMSGRLTIHNSSVDAPLVIQGYYNGVKEERIGIALTNTTELTRGVGLYSESADLWGNSCDFVVTANKTPNGGMPEIARITNKGQIVPNAEQGTAPISVSSTTVCPNLNADMVDGFRISPPARGGVPVSTIYNNTKTVNNSAGNWIKVISNCSSNISFSFYSDYNNHPGGAVVYVNGFSHSEKISIYVERPTGYNFISYDKIVVIRLENGYNDIYLVTREMGTNIFLYSTHPIDGTVYSSVSDSPIASLDLYRTGATWSFASNYNFAGNADTATKLATPRTLWGQSFDGSGNVSGSISLEEINFKGTTQRWEDSFGVEHSLYGITYCPNNHNARENVYHTTISDYFGIYLRTDKAAICMTCNGNIGVNTASPTEALDVAGNIKTSGTVYEAYNSDLLGLQVANSRKYNFAQISVSSTFAPTTSNLKPGTEYHFIIENVGSSAITIAIPTIFKSNGLDSITIDPDCYGEINVISDGSYLYLRAIDGTEN